MMKRFSEDELIGKPLSEKQKQELLALAAMRDEDIDFSDIPEIRELPPGAIRGRDFHPGAPMPVYLNRDLQNYLQAAARRKGVTLNYLVNDLLSREIGIVEAIK
jgi:hypothetical protein